MGKKLCKVLSLGLSFIVVTYIMVYMILDTKRISKPIDTAGRDPIYQKPFAYYIQTEQCLNSYLLETLALGNASVCDVYILSFKKKCHARKTPSHFTYVFNDAATTWSKGRNFMYKYVKDLNIRYRFHIFMDDDVQLFYSDAITKFSKATELPEGSPELSEEFYHSENYKEAIREIRGGKSAWRTYEETLLKSSPAFAVVSLIELDGLQTRLIQEEKYSEICGSHSKMPLITPTFFIDAIIIGYHEKALPILLPYNPMMDNVNWFIAAIFQIFRAKAVFYKQGICNWGLSAINWSHRPYPRNQIPDSYLQRYFEEEGKDIRGILNEHDTNFVMFYDNGKWKDVFFADKGVCGKHIKFPVTDHYRIS